MAITWHQPPPQPPLRGAAAASVPPASTVQPLRAFAAVPHTAVPPRRAPAGDELLSLPGGGFQLRLHDRQVMARPNGTYNFVRVQGLTRNQTTTVLSPRAAHAALAAGRPVLYAGTAAFADGQLDWWSNYSGTYQPQAEFNRQAGLPADKFIPWQKLQMGGLGLQRGMLGERRAALAPERPAAKAASPDRAGRPGPAATSSAATKDATATAHAGSASGSPASGRPGSG